MCLGGSGYAWPLLLFEQPTFASTGHVCVGGVGSVLMMELASLMFHWSNVHSNLILFFDFYFGRIMMMINYIIRYNPKKDYV